MGIVPILKPREVIAILECLGFQEVRQRGSHKQRLGIGKKAVSPNQFNSKKSLYLFKMM